MQNFELLTIPGRGDSGLDHWQSYWEMKYPNVKRIIQQDWESGSCEEWVGTIDSYIKSSEKPVIIAAHSVGCIAFSHWVLTACNSLVKDKVVGALMVAPADIEASWGLEKEPYRTFLPIPLSLLPFPSMVIASTDDPYLSLERANQLASIWHSDIRIVGALEHIGSESNLKYWPQGWEFVNELAKKVASLSVA